MIADSHCHAWRCWPHQPAVPDPAGHGSADLLLYEMDRAGVERAAIVCARIGDNDDNNEYVADAARRHPDRLAVIADVDCYWRPEYHTPGAAERLQEAAERLDIVGFTHYVDGANDGWFVSDEGMAFFAIGAELGLIASLSVSPGWQADLRRVADAFPTMPILVHHLGLVAAGDGDGLAQVLASAVEPNIYVKVSGFHYASARSWDFPYADARSIFSAIYRAYGAERLCWGSDFPEARSLLTYRQALEVVRSWCDFVAPGDMDAILGGSLMRVINGPR